MEGVQLYLPAPKSKRSHSQGQGWEVTRQPGKHTATNQAALSLGALRSRVWATEPPPPHSPGTGRGTATGTRRSQHKAGHDQ